MIYKKLKNTEAGFIPRDWQKVRLGDAVTYIKGKKPTEMIEEHRDNYIPYLSTEYLRENRSTKYVKNSNEILFINNGDLILLWDGSNAGEFFLGKKGVLSSTMVMFIFNEERFVKRFLFYFLKMKENYIQSQTKGTGIPHVDRNVLNNLQIFLPPLSEQKKITEIISTAECTIREVDKSITKAKRLKKGLMQELLAEGIGHKEFRETEIGKIPKKWKVEKLGDALELCQYGLSIKMDKSGKYPIIKMDDIVDGVVIPDKVKYINLDEKIFKNFKLEKGDILFNRTNSYELVGRTGIFLLNGDFVFASYLIRLRANKDIMEPQFLKFYMLYSNNKIKRQLATRAVHQANINATNLQKFKVPLPPLPEQNKIAEILSTIDNRIQLLKEKKNKLERVKKGLMNELLTGRRRVKVEA